jgi:hypothetical protein
VENKMTHPSEDKLSWFELELAPNICRFAVVPGQPVLFSPPMKGNDRDWGLIVFKPDSPSQQELFDEILSSLDALAKKYHILESPMHEANRAFGKRFQQEPSLHLRFAYASGRRWVTWYPKQAIPRELQYFIQETMELGFAKLSKGKKLSNEEALNLFRQQNDKKE